MKNKKMLIIPAVLLLVLGAAFFVWKKYSSRENSAPADQAVEVTGRPQAETIAKKFLEKQTFKNDYAPAPVSIEAYPDFWNVWFATIDKGKRPNRGLVQIERSTGKAEWKELQ